MYIEIKTDDRGRLHRLLDEVIDEGQRAMLTLGKDGDFYVLSVNTTAFQPITGDAALLTDDEPPALIRM